MLTDKEAKSRTESPRLSSTGIEHIAQLARIKLTEKEKDKFRKELSSILDYVKKLNELDTEKIEPLYQVTGIVNALRPDEYRKDFEMDKDLNEKLIGQAPQSENRFIKVKSVLKK
ncbi:MAG: Asp-tRNA(Asn)/Glu-tRNA(Gln) amidotransferase subunit GatC [Candidatus Yanofskybacteria bacterium]|nr:Asp-tRNA(Asn)/Glu-tRNA(Gln) amidotransferase subunit GatC [Candidatus Yanofskybacteria bacterium]